MRIHMNTIHKAVGGVAVAAAIVAGVIMALQSFDASKVACDGIDEARANLQALFDTGVNASVQVYAEERAMIDERLSQCLHAKPVDPCADAQKARDAAVEAFNGIPSPADDAPYTEFQTYFKKRDDAYNNYKNAKSVLEQCRAANPPKPDVPYEESDTKACFDEYDASIESARDTFEKDTQAMRSALRAALAALDAREKACNPPTGKEKFTDPDFADPDYDAEGASDGVAPTDLMSCKEINADLDTELFKLRQRAAAIPGEIQAVQASIDNIRKRMSPLQVALSEVDTYIPPESAKTQFEGALNALRAERKVAIEAALEFYNNLLARRQAEKATLEQELSDVQAQIAARLAQINAENAARRRNFPTNVHLAGPDECKYYHCHGMLCGRSDPAPDGCGHGSTTQEDVDCKQFIDAYLKAGGVN